MIATFFINLALMIQREMSRLPLWLILGMCIIGGRPHTVTYMEMLLASSADDPVHRVEQDSTSTGIQKIKILVDKEPYESFNSRVTVLPLSIESVVNPNHDDFNIGGSRETTAKRQAVVNQSGKQSNKNTATVRKTSIQSSSSKIESKANPKPEPVKPEPKPVVKNEPKPSQYGIGSTIVLTVKGTGNEDTVDRVDQSQPHKLAKPLRFESQFTSQQQSQNQGQTEKERIRAAPIESRPEVKKDRYPEVYDPVPVQQNPPRKDESTVYDEYYDGNREKVQVARPDYSYEQTRPEVAKTQDYETPEIIRTEVKDTHQQTYGNSYQPENVENPRKVYRPEPEDAYVERPMTQSQRRPTRPIYEEVDRPAVRPTQEEGYVRVRPEKPVNQESRRPTQPQESSEYAGFPESHQPTRNTGLSRPLQFDPPRVFPPSPCHSVFKYEGREPGQDSWVGDIYVSTDEVLVGMRLDITLDRPARLLANYISDAKTKDNIHFTILSLRKRLVPGPAETVRILVRFHLDNPVPYLQSINLNGRKICPTAKPTTRRPIYENPGDFQTKRTTEYYEEATPVPIYEERPRQTTRVQYQPERPTTEAYRSTRKPQPSYVPPSRPDPNPNNVESSHNNNRLPTQQPSSKPFQSVTPSNEVVMCGKPAVQPRPLVTHGQMTARGQWPWHAAIYKNVGTDLSYICGGSLISSKYVVTAAHCVTKSYDVKPLDASVLVVFLGKYHLRLWSEGGVQNKQVAAVKVHPEYNSTDFRADLAVLQLSSAVEFTEYIRPVCLWDSKKTDISDIENKEGTVIGWGFDEAKRLTEDLMQAKMPVIKHDVCLWSYPEFFPQFTSNVTYCAGFRNGTSVCNGDSGGGMVFPIRVNNEERWRLRGLVSISVSEKESRVCDTKHYVVFTDLAKFLDWLNHYV